MPSAYAVFTIPSSPDFHDILIATLADIGFEGFEEEEKSVKAYIDKKYLDLSAVKAIMDQYNINGWRHEPLMEKNWNEEWERGFQPVVINPQVRIRAPFHKADPAFKHDIVINPKMAFGTGHHDTTSMMMSLMIKQDFTGMDVIDYGTGTGILAILAEKEGASSVLAFDNDPICIENVEENLALNRCSKVNVELGEINNFENKVDILLANITRNTLIETMQQIGFCVRDTGLFIASGFYLQDIPALGSAARQHGFLPQEQLTQNQWAAVVFIKS